MKLKIYNIGLVAIISLMALSANAQQTPAEPIAPQQPIVGSGRIDQNYTLTSSDRQQPGDTVYRNKMRKLQEQMRGLSREMADLNRDQAKKNQEQQQVRVITMRNNLNVKFDSSFNHNINKSLSNNLRFNFDSDNNLQKQVQSGEVKEKSKTYSKSYPVDANDKLQIDNKFGKITVNTWAKNEVKVDVDIKSYAMDDSEAQNLLDQTSVSSNKENNVVAFTTAIDRENNSWWGTSSQNGKITKVRKVLINYTVYMPVKSALTITNRYGAIVLPNLDGKLNINNSYGSLSAKTLTNADNVISVRYGSANIVSLNSSDLNIAYGSLQLESADKLNADIRFSPVKIGKLGTLGTFNIRYGSGLEISDVGKNIKTLTVNSSYAPVKLGSLHDTNADFDVTVHYGDFLYDAATNITSKSPEDKRYNPTKNYKGYVGKGNSDKMITVKSTYSTVKFD